MGKIKILSEEVSNRIAAGEVIERPASIVKELVENSIDAGATKIFVTIENGGKRFIQIIDNGDGMSEDDALQAFERHATSKINNVSDIFTISSLGFRGEALPSIASVSNLTLITKDCKSDLAAQIDFGGGRLLNVSKTSANQGTSITVRKLFHNVPARKKFLKSSHVEMKHIMNYLHYQSIMYPKINFKFISDSKEKLNYPSVETQDERMLAIFGSQFMNTDLISISYQQGMYKLTGFLGGLENEAATIEDYRYIYVNGRFIKDRIIYHSIKSAYEPFIKKFRIFQQGKTPPYIIFLTLEPGQVDFNVHPAKLEIRFNDPGGIHSFIKNSVTNALLKYEEDKFKQVKSKLSSTLQQSKTTPLENKIFTNKTDKKRFSEYKKEFNNIYQPDIFVERTEEDAIIEERLIKPANTLFLKPEEEIINPWQLHQSYIFVQVEEGLMVIDQHAAHERVLYEKILHRIHGALAPTQKLLFPIVVNLPPYLSQLIPDLVNENIETFRKVGFSIKTFSGDSIVIDEIPIELEDWDGGDIFIEILKQLNDEFSETQDFRDSLAKSVSCKAAIKAGLSLIHI